MPSDFQQKVFNTLAVLGLSQVQIRKERNGTFTLKSSAYHKRLIYFILRVNTILKFIFLVLLSCGTFQEEFEFFEKMAIVLWYLIFILLSISEKLFYKKYPFFELLTAWWRIEECVYQKLGKPKKFLDDMKWVSMWRVWFQGIIALTGILAVIVQYDAAPKYCVFAYSLVPSENVMIKWLFGIHETLFLCHAWIVYGSVIYISSVMGAELVIVIESLREVMELFIIQSGGTRNYSKMYSPSIIELIPTRRSVIASGSGRIHYNPVSLVQEYNKVQMVVTQLNNIASYNFLYMHGCSYVQMVSDVFQMIQILRGPDADFMAVVFFCEDMLVCMYMLFRCFKSMAFVQPNSVQFLEKFRDFMASRKPITSRFDRAVLMKTRPTLRHIAFKLGPCTVGPWTVGMAMDVLLQYYICVALW